MDAPNGVGTERVAEDIPITWDEASQFLIVDGTRREIQVLGAGAEGWQRLIEGLRQGRHAVSFTDEGEGLAWPDTVERSFWYDLDHTRRIHIDVGGLRVVAYFFVEPDVEFTVQPRDIQASEQFLALLDFMRQVASLAERPAWLMHVGRSSAAKRVASREFFVGYRPESASFVRGDDLGPLG